MKKIRFTELNFVGYERKLELEVDEYRTTKNQNGTYNIICKIGNEKKVFNNCTHPKLVKPEKNLYAWNDTIHELFAGNTSSEEHEQRE